LQIFSNEGEGNYGQLSDVDFFIMTLSNQFKGEIFALAVKPAIVHDGAT
jgi:hypothetical protein